MSQNFSRSPNRRISDRKKRRIPCQLWVGEREHNALVLDLSISGLFVQTHAKVQRGQRLELRLSQAGAGLDLVVEVARANHVPPNLMTVAKGGIGVRIVDPPEEYYELLAALGITEHAEPQIELEHAEGPRFRVQVAQTSGPRSRRIEVSASDAETAAAVALEEIGEGWKVLRVELL